MNKFYYKSLLIFIIFFLSFNKSKSQCVVCVEAPPLITCGESATLLGEGYITSTYSDDFNSWTSPTNPSSLWANVSTGGTTNSNCTGSPTSTSSCVYVGFARCQSESNRSSGELVRTAQVRNRRRSSARSCSRNAKAKSMM